MQKKEIQKFGLFAYSLILLFLVIKGDTLYNWIVNSVNGRILVLILILYITFILIFVFIKPKFLFKFLFAEETPSNARVLYGISLICGAFIVLLSLIENHHINIINKETNRINAESNVLNYEMNKITEKGNLDNRFNNAVILLNSDKTSLILAGIYALNQIAIEASQGHTDQIQYVKIIHDIFCAYLRGDIKESKKEPIIVKTMLEILYGTRNTIYSKYYSDLSGIIVEDIKIDSIYMSNANIDSAVFKNVTIGTSIEKDNKNFNKLIPLNETIKNVQFINVNIYNMEIKNLSFISCFFEQSTFYESLFNNSNWESCTFLKSKFFKSKISYSNFTFPENYISNNTLQKDKIEINKPNKFNETEFLHTNLYYVNFSESKFIKASFDYSTLEHINFTRASFSNTSFGYVSNLNCKTIDFHETIFEKLNCEEIKSK